MIDENAARLAVETLSEVVQRDGGNLKYVGVDPDDGAAVIVEFDSGQNDDCETCSFTADVVHDFLLESLRSNNASVASVRVVEI